MTVLTEALLLVAYVALLAVVTGLVEDIRWRAVVYSVPVPMSVIVLVHGAPTDGSTSAGVLLLGTFFWIVSLWDRSSFPRFGAVLIAAAAYFAMGSFLNQVWNLSSAWTFLIAALLWGAISVFLAKSGPDRRVTVAPVTLRRVFFVAAISVVAVAAGEVLGSFLITFPFAGVAVAATYPGPVAPFARTFWLRGIPPLLIFILIIELASGFNLPSGAAIGLAFLAWAGLTISIYLASSRIERRTQERIASAIAALLLRDPGNRGIRGLSSSEELAASLMSAAQALSRAQSVLIVTGFPIPTVSPPTPETDGPPGSLGLAVTLRQLGVQCLITADPLCADVVEAAVQSSSERENDELTFAPSGLLASLDEYRPDVIVFVERPGHSADGIYYSMRGIPIEGIEPLDHLPAHWPGAVVIGIGDGGNEAGMGNIGERVAESVPNGSTIASVVRSDHLIVAGTSNWGAHGLACMVRSLDRRSGPQTNYSLATTVDRMALRACVAAGAIDGVLGQRSETVDGLAPEVYEEVLTELDDLTASFA